ncbi:SURF1 family protein [Rhizorhabdus sp. FW153]|uniref:SURF1 family protein n=1 Tax=Rhizorhabdus sp. FW153 TaxID=3400216 RepID=UPI003CE88DB2
MRRPARTGAALVLLALALVFVGLGVWQVQRRAWKHALIATVEGRVHAAPVAPPAPGRLTSPDVTDLAYLRIVARGRYRPGPDILVRAVSDLGAGYWVMTPFDTDNGFAILVNRGFVAQDDKDRARWRPNGAVVLTGLLRPSEPGGGFLRANDPAGGRWYSRDVASIARAARLGPVAPYFVDAGRLPGGDGPVGGLTVIRFSDNHAVYALTWFIMALMSAFGAWWLSRPVRPLAD